MGKHSLFAIGARGVNVVTAPTHLMEEELTDGQNAEYVSVQGEGAIDQRTGMTRMNSVAFNSGASILAAQDVPSPLLADFVPTLYVPFITASAHRWRKSTDGTTWTTVDNPATYIHNPTSNSVGYFKNFPRMVTIGRYMYFAGAVNAYGTDPIPIWQFDGTSARILSYVPPAVVGTVLATPAAPVIIASGDSTSGSSTWTYKWVAKAGASHSAASAAVSLSSINGTLDNAGHCEIDAFTGFQAPPVTGATSYDVYRTATGSSPNTTGLITNVPIVDGAFAHDGVGRIFRDTGLAGDSSTPPGSATGSLSSAGFGLLDMITDGTSIYIAVLDVLTSAGRILQFFPQTLTWVQVGPSFATSDGNGIAGTLFFHDGALNFATYFGTGSGNTVYAKSTGTPLPIGGISAIHTFATSLSPASAVVFQGTLYLGMVWLGAAGTAGIVLQRTALDTWATARTGPGTATKNGYTALGVFNGRLFAGWTSGDGSSAARIESSPNGVDWTNEITLDVAEVPSQMVTFGNKLYVCLGKSQVESYNTKSRVISRDLNGTWATADDPADDFTGAIGVVYA